MKLKNVVVAILASDGFEQVELVEPRKALEQAGATTRIVAPSADEVQGWNHLETGDKFRVDVHLENAHADDFDALLIPGGVANPDRLRGLSKAVEFVKKLAAQGKPIAAICHGPWLLIEAGLVRGRKVTSWPTLKTDLKNAGANWVDQEVVVDQGLVTSRKPADIPAFSEMMVEEFAARRAPGIRARA
jgi:protease I